uniref:Uncharacterized protein n=1 Tax=Pithovirus LCPAC302 TaxID=2506593 RepID=A0A481Z6G6_9VIRU|nr:MAG: hypothetical protein LCPAC302_00940 [Pithovirus LCPAC302]QBK91551.1 MAG: uncharacterized protein LCPAC302_01710 [Pithovirus LCPAC302]
MNIPIQEFIWKFGTALGLLAILDFGCYKTRARYFTLHGIWNILISSLIIPDLFKFIMDPLGPSQDATQWPGIFVAAIHFWHCIAYSGLTWDDYFHHIVFATTLTSANFIWDWGYGANFLIFFICGLPGGLDYIMLACVKHGYLSKIKEKRWNRYLNTWIRSPGCIASACSIWVNWMAGNTNHIPVLVKIVMILLVISNGQYYSSRVTASWAIHEHKLSCSK